MASLREELLNSPDFYVEEACKKSRSLSRMSQYEEIEENLSYTFDNAIIQFFGSITFGLGHCNSDLDIFIDLYGDDFFSDKNKKVDASRLQEVERSLDDDDWEIKVLLRYATVPLLKVKYLPLNLDCDIVVSNGLGVKNSQFINHLFNIQPEARKLFHFVRMWIKSYKFNLKSYTLTLLVIFFLQNKNLMPTGERVQRYVEEEYIDGWNVSFDEDKNWNITCYGTRKLRSYHIHLVDFFIFYKNFDYNYIMSTFKGTSVLREIYPFNSFKIDTPMCIAGPINRGYNSSYNIGKSRLKKFIKICSNAVVLLNEYDFY
ncbi:hypothetical protein PVAND_007653 [Polypedilum vanderplanki]|uniref:Poly(A) RNA polymerase mitochondrial-like central palm domain-containing protein n=1 Tax=Polypedilum vanderplanki TaxID=319348 RepID=A0A9J6C810_POLVA|nr:hypothetical protein PVAND_007653 [Polypedilum vanderplanki]